MAAKPKQKPKLKLTGKEQSERFKETARRLNTPEMQEAFERVFKKIAPPRRKPPRQTP